MSNTEGTCKGGCVGVPGATKLYRNVSLRDALEELARTPATIDSIRDAIAERFGNDQTPSRSAIGRYVRRVRLASGINFLRIGRAN